MDRWHIGVAVLVVYLAAVLYLGYRSSRASKGTFVDHAVASRSFGVFVLTLTFAATFHSAYAFTGIVGFAGTEGIPFWVNGLWLVPPAFLFWQVGKRLWILGQRHNYVTLAEYLGDVHQSRPLAMVVAAGQSLFAIPYVTIQLAGSGFIFDTLTDGKIPFKVGAAVMLAVMVIYVWAGGIRAVAWTDTLQGILMFVVIFAGGWWVVREMAGSVSGLFQAAADQFPAAFSLPGAAGTYTDSMSWVSQWLPMCIGIVLAPQIVMRVFTARSLTVLKWSSIAGAVFLVAIYTFTPAVGLAWQLYSPDTAPDQFFVSALWDNMPLVLGAFALSTGFAAAMSTADSQIHAISVTMTNDVYAPIRRRTSDREKRHVGHIVHVLIGVAAYIFLITNPGLMIDIVTISVAGTALLAPTVAVALYTSRANTVVSITSIVVGSVLLVGWTFIWDPPTGIGISAAMWSLLVSSVISFVGSLMVRPATPDRPAAAHQTYLDKILTMAVEEPAATERSTRRDEQPQ